MSAEINPRELAVHLENGQAVQLIDVRQPWESQLVKLPGSLPIPLGDLPQRVKDIPTEPAVAVVLYCHHGVRSLSAVEYLRRLGYSNVRSLAGGIDAWACEVDPTLPRY
jgi:adenylyltransferase/sulfurtransferase